MADTEQKGFINKHVVLTDFVHLSVWLNHRGNEFVEVGCFVAPKN